MSKRDYTLIIDRSGSMAIKDQPGGRSRWATARESAHALAAKCEELDPDGITLYVFGSRFRRYDNVTAERVGQVFVENEPAGGTDLAGVLSHAFGSYFDRKRAGEAKAEGETIVVVTDGEPDDQKAVMKTIVDATRRLDRDEELGLSLVQVGKDPLASRFLKALDDDLVRVGARFDICDTVTLDEMEELSLTEVLLRAIHD
jgi:von Willebrand factor type A domain